MTHGPDIRRPTGVPPEVLARLWWDFEHCDRASLPELADAVRRTRALEGLTETQLAELLEQLAANKLAANLARDRLLEAILASALGACHARLKESGAGRQEPAPDVDARRFTAVVQLYHRLPPQATPRGYLLALLVVPPSESGVARFTELLVTDPPASSQAVDLAFAALFQMKNVPVAAVFPRLFAALEHTHVAAAILDLANHWTRSRQVAEHPGKSYRHVFAALLGDVSMRLGSIAESGTEADTPEEAAERVARGVQLAVGLCDALALIGEPDVVGKLYQALELPHRRVRTEAAAALARLGEAAGRTALLELVAEPVARLRVLAYAAELDLLDEIPEEFQTGQAQAEAEIAAWLSEPTQFGLAPTRLEPIDARTLAWPGYDEPRECYLFRFVYQLAGSEYANIAIAGPLTQAFEDDLADLPPDDIYAAFAGWHVSSPEISSFDPAQLPPFLDPDRVRLERRLRDAGYTDLEAEVFGLFFGERLLAATAKSDGQAGAVVIAGEEINWFPHRATRRPLGPKTALQIVEGRKLLRAFNG